MAEGGPGGRAADIVVEGLEHIYPSGVKALKGVSVRVPAGERLAVIGENGSGKTTLVKHLNGLLKPTAGSVMVGDLDTREHSVARLASLVGYVFQNPDDQLFKPTVKGEVMFGPRNLGWDEDRAAAQAVAALRIVGLEDAQDRHPYDLSPGQRRRVALASVLAMDTPVIVLDEPTTGQDFEGVRLIGEIVEDLRRTGKTVIAVTHDMDFCAEHFERVLALVDGRVLLDGPARNVLSQADVLAQTDVEPPQMIRLALRLGLERMPLTVAEFIAFRYGDEGG